MGRSFGKPEMLKPYPVKVVALAAPRFAAARTSVFARAPRIERQGRAVIRADAAIHRQERLLFRNYRQALQHRLRALAQMRQQRAQIRRTANDRRASRQVLGSHHVFSPSTAQEKGRTRAPACATAGAAARASPFIRKNIEPPAPAPAAFPPSAPPPPAAATALSSCANSVVRIPASSAC